MWDLNYVGYTTRQLIADHRYSAIGRHLKGGGGTGGREPGELGGGRRERKGREAGVLIGREAGEKCDDDSLITLLAVIKKKN